MLKLYCAPLTVSTCVVFALNEGVHWEPIRVDVAGGEQTGKNTWRLILRVAFPSF